MQDAAEVYSVDGVTSQWWVDLDDQLDHYIHHGKTLQNSVVDWRNDLVSLHTLAHLSLHSFHKRVTVVQISK